ncbi:winged helix-turn-helix domain-containing protein [Haloglomus salinum]|jgi:DNA-binding MarR family transcriptional regulator|uniref:winged helix-turn-helix domain-containing protein n=1 Tax=Haloglomus salinum TaxID=2962673 RepID=UPI0020C9AA71|nr:winged helix-turn-helix domain-containing protein [Haloglomus salinum]
MARTDALAVDERSDPGAGAERAPDWETVADLPASAKLVARVLEHEGTLSGTEIAEETRLPPRTVRYAVGRLGEAGVVTESFSLRDAREKRYELRID